MKSKMSTVAGLCIAALLGIAGRAAAGTTATITVTPNVLASITVVSTTTDLGTSLAPGATGYTSTPVTVQNVGAIAVSLSGQVTDPAAGLGERARRKHVRPHVRRGQPRRWEPWQSSLARGSQPAQPQSPGRCGGRRRAGSG